MSRKDLFGHFLTLPGFFSDIVAKTPDIVAVSTMEVGVLATEVRSRVLSSPQMISLHSQDLVGKTRKLAYESFEAVTRTSLRQEESQHCL